MHNTRTGGHALSPVSINDSGVDAATWMRFPVTPYPDRMSLD